MRRNNNTRTPPVRPRREPDFDEPIRRWSTLPVSKERACELVDLITRREDSESRDALIQLICGLTPHIPSDDKDILDERFLAGRAALMHAFNDTTRAVNDLGAYVVGLKCAEWE
ncbi:MAG TPA: hypothetical protein VD835_12655 [Pyrinomonadaceae bacterium]|nr:hypothetical protein [Pyrinomonadaceae bacterium]